MTPTPDEFTKTSQLVARTSSGGRGAVALLCWLLSSIGMMTSVMTSLSAAVALPLKAGWGEAFTASAFYLGWIALYAWIALGVMTAGWVSHRAVHWVWPLTGALAGLLSFFVMLPMSLAVFPCAVLGVLVTAYHFLEPSQEKRGAPMDNAKS
jgi:hypothetical protein